MDTTSWIVVFIAFLLCTHSIMDSMHMQRIEGKVDELLRRR